MTNVTVNFAAPADDAAIRRLLREQPMPGRVSIAYEREPDFSLGCAVTGDDCRILVARADGREVVGVACRSVRSVFVNGREQRLGYLGQLRINETFRGRWLVSRGFSLLKQVHDEDQVPAYLVSIIDENREATGVLVRNRRKHFPNFYPVANYCTLALNVTRPRPPQSCSAQLHVAMPDQLGEVARFLRAHGPRRQFFPIWTEDALLGLAKLGLRAEDMLIARRDGKIVGVAALWDQSAYKQSVIRGYSGWLKLVAPLYNLGAPWLGRNALPRPGQKLSSAYAALIAVAGDDTAVFSGLLRELYNLTHSRRFDYLLLGLDARDPLLPVARTYAHILYPSRIYLAEWPDGGGLHEQLDQRSVYVDIATL